MRRIDQYTLAYSQGPTHCNAESDYRTSAARCLSKLLPHEVHDGGKSELESQLCPCRNLVALQDLCVPRSLHARSLGATDVQPDDRARTGNVCHAENPACHRSLRRGMIDRLAEANRISERVDHACLERFPRGLFQPGPHVTVFVRDELFVKGVASPHHDAKAYIGTTVSVMFAEM